MSDFAGTFEHSLDAKNRVIIPTAFREGLGDNFTIALNGTANAIAFYPQVQWESVKNRLSRVSNTDEAGMAYKSFIMGNAFTGNTCDSQGRVLLPGKLRAMIGITKELVFVGMNETIEVLDAKTHSEREAQVRASFKDLLRHMEERY